MLSPYPKVKLTLHEVISKLTNTIESCSTVEQLDNAHAWAYKVFESKYKHTRAKTNGNAGIFECGEVSGMWDVISVMIVNKRRAIIGDETEFNPDNVVIEKFNTQSEIEDNVKREY
ncbi:MAG: hypothetical protein ACRDD8_09755 [Bacteroidales bacterium]